MGWLFNPKYFGPDRRAGKFQVRFLERRRTQDAGSRETLQSVLPQLRSRGMRWVDHANYFGPDRRSVFSVFFLERRKEQADGSPPPLHAALRQLRMRVLDADDAQSRTLLCERLIATAILADSQGHTRIGDLLVSLAHHLEEQADDADPRQVLHAELNRAEAMQG
jgi:hypothetical protein